MHCPADFVTGYLLGIASGIVLTVGGFLVSRRRETPR